ncbi:hypothetical protein Tsedi_00979 [Tepidimonas sediminis]|uniref:Cofactor-independent phosphoglycerate mutase n=1 Tax=Tepidimonas sediminis TaxID=2588941 RepID=A0A554WRG9_9BURK|nr:phosphoglycerate mutase [Tepidimonas sediminis]TSE26164.1 hypothetical protein Tsedi_00979 [Tepidimonas sediminis]
MHAPRHWIIAHACADDPALLAELPGLALPALRQWLQAARAAGAEHAGAQTLSPPHERALARALGWPVQDGALPWAAWRHGRADQPCAWLLPCHWQVSLDHLVLLPPQALALQDDEAEALRTAWAPLAREEGLTLEGADGPAWRWLACGAAFEGWKSASLARVAHRRLDPSWQPGADHAQGRRLRRLLEEAAMLWHVHPVNAARQARGLPVINGLWVEGAGRWHGEGPRAAEARVVLVEDLSAAALQGQVTAWREGWQRLDREVLAPALQQACADGEPRWLTLCGERGWRSWCLDPAAPAAPPRRRWWLWGRRETTPAPPQAWWVDL